jgi:AhpD family alkylhydroperoxidase
MAYLPSLPPGAVLLDVFRAYPQTARPLLDYHQALLRGPSPLSVAERELIAAYVSGLNACGYCHGVHAATAEAFGIPEDTLDVRREYLARTRAWSVCPWKGVHGITRSVPAGG